MSTHLLEAAFDVGLASVRDNSQHIEQRNCCDSCLGHKSMHHNVWGGETKEKETSTPQNDPIYGTSRPCVLLRAHLWCGHTMSKATLAIDEDVLNGWSEDARLVLEVCAKLVGKLACPFRL